MNNYPDGDFIIETFNSEVYFLYHISSLMSLQPKAGQQHYENICMKAVNQSIGKPPFHIRQSC